MAKSEVHLNSRVTHDIADRLRQTSRMSGVSIKKLVSYYLEKSFIEAGHMDPADRTVILSEEVQKLVDVPVEDATEMRTLRINCGSALDSKLQHHLERAEHHLGEARSIARQIANQGMVVFSENTLIEKLID